MCSLEIKDQSNHGNTSLKIIFYIFILNKLPIMVLANVYASHKGLLAIFRYVLDFLLLKSKGISFREELEL